MFSYYVWLIVDCSPVYYLLFNHVLAKLRKQVKWISSQLSTSVWKTHVDRNKLTACQLQIQLTLSPNKYNTHCACILFLIDTGIDSLCDKFWSLIFFLHNITTPFAFGQKHELTLLIRFKAMNTEVRQKTITEQYSIWNIDRLMCFHIVVLRNKNELPQFFKKIPKQINKCMSSFLIFEIINV